MTDNGQEQPGTGGGPRGVDPATLSEPDLLRELEAIHRSRHDTLLHGSAAALAAHDTRMGDLEAEYLSSTPARGRAASPVRAPCPGP
ncbi:DUF6158 family protein [Streptomyces sp. NPDC047966]|uniref:DUF6158 family protein n=1 Tax=Streptomyces sp. NPDC047966 TaxID=3155745 RepID=UPI00341D7AAF